MKYNVQTLTSAEYLKLVNQEENPDTDELAIKYCRIGNSYFAYANSSIGKIVTPAYNKGTELAEDEVNQLFDEATETIKKEYDIRSTSLVKSPSFIKNPLTPGL